MMWITVPPFSSPPFLPLLVNDGDDGDLYSTHGIAIGINVVYHVKYCAVITLL